MMLPEDCRRLLGRISAYLDGDLDASDCADVEAHARSCAHCAALTESLRQTIGLCRKEAAVPLPVEVRARARARVQQLLDATSPGAHHEKP